MNKLIRLLELGQSYWLDNLTRGKIKSGELKRRAAGQGLRGITSNPDIFHKAISESNDYDAQIKQLASKGKSVKDIYEALVVKDVRDACDILRKVYDESDGTDGFVSLEVSPHLAHDEQGTLQEVRRLFKAVDRPNCFIKIPGTAECISAIEEALYEGININITLLFSITTYEAVAEAYVRALERRMNENKPVSQVASVASFFLSRIDILADQLLSQRYISEKGIGSSKPENLFGMTAVASAKLAYKSFKNIFTSERWEKLARNGAHVQKPLWASTSSKDPLYRDVIYVETLIGKNTINTLPDKTIEAFADHGILKADTIEENITEAEKVFIDLKESGIDIDFITDQLVNEGIQKFTDSFDKLIKKIALERIKYTGKKAGVQQLNSSEYSGVFKSVNQKNYSRRLLNKDPFLWTNDKKEADKILNRLGWLDSLGYFADKTDEIKKFADEIKKEKFKYAVLLGMGGSSLCPEVMQKTFGNSKGYPELIVLDNTSPEAVKSVENAIESARTLFIVASKSGSTTETDSFYKYFFSKIESVKGAQAGKHFVAVTDPGSSLGDEGKEKNFRKVFENRQDIGGRYSALSYFGLVPMAVIGIDIKKILQSAEEILSLSSPFIPAEADPAVSLGVFLGFNQQNGRDKVTFILSESIKAFGYWVEQLIAESTGKSGVGIVPVESEKPASPSEYGNDRIFVSIHLKGDTNPDLKKLEALEKAGYPVVRIELADKYALGGEFLRWEIATAAAGAVMRVNPFDEPNVSESKKNTKDLLNEWMEYGSFKTAEPVAEQGSISVICKESAEWFGRIKTNNISQLLNSFVKLASGSDYISLLAYLHNTPVRFRELQVIRHKLRNKLKCAATLGFGPRYLHSTGQLHKGGADKGVFILFTADPSIEEMPIPGEKYSFAVLNRAQALGDYRSLNDKGRRVILIHLTGKPEEGLKKISSMLK